MNALARPISVHSRLSRITGLALVALLFAACTTAMNAAGFATPSPSGPAAASAAASAGASAANGSAGPIDPCQLVTAHEASSLTGVTYTQGTSATVQGLGATCTYGTGTNNVFTVVVDQASDPASAQAAQKAAEAAVKTQVSGVDVETSPISGIGDAADFMSAFGTVGGATVGASAIYVIKGNTVFGFSDVAKNSPVPSSAGLETQATRDLSRLG